MKQKEPTKFLTGIASNDEQKGNLIANTFVDNYTENKRPGNHATNIDSDVTNTLTRFFSTPLTSPIPPTDPDEICDYVKKLKNSKAPGSDNITNKMIKKFPLKIIIIFIYIINKILLLRHFPNNWKVAIVFPIHKPEKNKNSPDSYKPISLLSLLSKISEHVILNSINSHVYNTNFLNPNQFGFTKQLSTYHPLLRLTEKIYSGFQRGRTFDAVFLDIQKAFDRVWIDGLSYKLIINNFPPAIIHILHSYLTNGKYKVRVNDTLSTTHHVNTGVTQGSLLGPVLFNIYVNDIPSHPRTMINLYADDTAISATYKNTKSVTVALNKYLALLEKYFNDWKIKINVDKGLIHKKSSASSQHNRTRRTATQSQPTEGKPPNMTAHSSDGMTSLPDKCLTSDATSSIFLP
ncbi:probable RNA-directed DNA polymerase from transposon BS [Trichonephila clavipes]|nr:probable RNA-directed DNA polymerase from transposon BS [Trichonephila clavipes]